MATDTRLNELVAELRANSAAERTQVREKLGALEAEVAALKIQVENASTPAAVDYSGLEAAIAEIKNILPDNPEPTETPNTTPLLPDSEAPLIEPDTDTTETPTL